MVEDIMEILKTICFMGKDCLFIKMVQDT